MTAEQPETPLPPEGYATWLDCLAEGDLDLARYDFARAELAALRKELAQANEHRHFCDAIDLAFTQQIEDLKKKLADTEGLLATARQQALDLIAKREEAVRNLHTVHEHVAEACNALGADGYPQDSWILREYCARRMRERDEAMKKLSDTEGLLAALRDELDQAKADLACLTISGDMLASDSSLFRGNSVRHWYDKAMAYKGAFHERDEAMKKLSDTEGWLATARQQALDLDAQRAEAVRERDEARAKLAELREAVLALGSLNATWIDDRMRYVEVQVDRGDARAWNALIAKLRAAQGGEGKP